VPILLLLGPWFNHLERQYQCTGQRWSKMRKQLVERDQRLSILLPQSAHDESATGVAYFINGQRTYGEVLFQIYYMPNDELIVVQAISGV
jgi:hypothetical protein